MFINTEMFKREVPQNPSLVSYDDCVKLSVYPSKSVSKLRLASTAII